MSFKPRLPDDDTLVLAVYHHVSVHVVSQCVDVGGVLVLSLSGAGHSISYLSVFRLYLSVDWPLSLTAPW